MRTISSKRLLLLPVLAGFLALAATIAVATASAARTAATGATDHTGVVRSIGASTLTIVTAKGKSYTFALTPLTAYERLGDPIAASAVKPGASVHVTFTDAGSTLTATDVAVGVVTQDGPIFTTKAKGSVNTVSTTALTVTTSKGKAISFRIGAALNVERMGKKLKLADVKPADKVKVRFEIGADGSLTATDIVVGAASVAGVLYSDVEKGTVAAISPGHLEVDKGSSPLPLAIVAATRVQRLGKTIPASMLRVGSKVKASFRIVSGGGLQADSIDLGVVSVAGTLYSGKEKGVVKAVSASSLAVTTKKGDVLAFRIGPRTTFARDGVAARPGAIRAGDAVKLKLDVAAGGALVAAEIEAGRMFRGDLVFATRQKGTVVKASGRTLVLRTAKGKTLSLSVAPTASLAVAGVAALPGDIASGDTVKVKYLQIAANVATSVHVVAGKSGFKAAGKVVRSSGQTLALRVVSLTRSGALQPRLVGHTVTISVPADALIRAHGRPSRLDRLPAGSTVTVIGRIAGPLLVARHVVS